MKKYVLLLTLMFFLYSGSAIGAGLDTAQATAILIKMADANETAADVNSTSWGYAKDWVEIPSTFSMVKVMFYVYDPNDPTDEGFDYQLYVADYGCSGQLVADANATVGLMQLSHDPINLVDVNSVTILDTYRWADKFGTITEDWMGTIYTQNSGGANGAAALIFDRESGKTINCLINGMTNAYMRVYCIAYGYK